MKKSSYKKPLICGELSFDPKTNRAWGIKEKDCFVHFRQEADDRAILYELIRRKDERLTYDEILQLIGKEKHIGQKTGRKYVNDKVEAIKRKLMRLGFSRDELKSMFICDSGYTLMRPRQGRKFIA